MTIAEWLDSRQPQPPAPLAADIRAAIAADLAKDSVEAAPVFLATAERLLRQLVASDDTSRAVASQVLTVDALTTYALEAASEMVDQLPGFADQAISRFSRVANESGGSTPATS